MSDSGPGVVHVDGGTLRVDVGGTCRAVGVRARATGAHVVVCHVADLPASDLATVEALARLHLAVQPGARVVLDGTAPALRALIDLAGLSDVLEDVRAVPTTEGLPTGGSATTGAGPAASGVEVQRQPEDAEVVGPHEVGDAADPTVPDLEQVNGPRVPPPGRAAGLVLREGG